MQSNKVYTNGHGVIEIEVIGSQTVASIDAMGEEVLRLVNEYRKAGKPVLVLDNLFQMGEVPTEGRQRVVALGKEIDYDKLAMVGSSGMLRLGANLMLHAVGKADKVKYFDDYDAAVHWLKSS